MGKLREAILFEENESYKNELMSMGIFVNDNFRCQIKIENNQCIFDCPILLLNVRGQNFGGLVKIECSICNKDIFECDHIIGRNYDGKTATGTAKELKIDHVAFVKNPLDPRCAVSQINESLDTILKQKNIDKNKFIPNKTPLYCDCCR